MSTDPIKEQVTDELIILRNGKTLTPDELVDWFIARLTLRGLVIAKPDSVVTEPIKVKPTPPWSIALSDLLGELVDPSDPNLYRGKDQDVYYLLADGKVWPRPTPTNPNPNGHVAVPGRFTLPLGWYWEPAESGDGAWSIVPYPTTHLGPEWLLIKEEVRPDAIPDKGTKEPGQWEYDPDKKN